MAASVEELAERLVQAFNVRDIEAVLALVDDEVEFDFGHKTLHGRQEVSDFVERQLYGAGYRASHRRRFKRGDELVVESRQELAYVETDELAGVEEHGALYVARDGRLKRYAEFPDLATALAASSVSEADEVSLPRTRHERTDPPVASPRTGLPARAGSTTGMATAGACGRGLCQ